MEKSYMKLITNNSLQSFEIFLSTPKGPEPVWITPRQTVAVPAGYISEQIHNMVNRRMLSVKNA